MLWNVNTSCSSGMALLAGTALGRPAIVCYYVNYGANLFVLDPKSGATLLRSPSTFSGMYVGSLITMNSTLVFSGLWYDDPFTERGSIFTMDLSTLSWPVPIPLSNATCQALIVRTDGTLLGFCSSDASSSGSSQYSVLLPASTAPSSNGVLGGLSMEALVGIGAGGAVALALVGFFVYKKCTKPLPPLPVSLREPAPHFVNYTPQERTPLITTCPDCGGEGFLQVSSRTTLVRVECGACNGTGKR